MWKKLNIFNFARHRIEFLIYILKIIPAKLEGRTLSVGPRNEGELLLLWMHGFKLKNTVGIDLFSYSPKILVMDIHCMSFEDNSFDTIICAWVLTYCYNLDKAISEIIRVAKNGALVAIGFSIPPPIEKSEPINKVSRLRGGPNELLNLFGTVLDVVYWQREVGGRASVIFRIKK
ncbi:MAG: methyltransferase domain-containing protein [bacterium]|nr:methyltransferase domain-containing protein [bacterium]